MKTNNTIMVASAKSNKSENKVWVVYTYRRKKQYCKNALTALRYAFILKAKTGRPISNNAFERLMFEIQTLKAL